MSNHQEHLDKAMLDPGDLYDSPAEVAQDERLTVEQQLAVLKNWANDVQQRLDAKSENMTPKQPKQSESNLLQAIDVEIEALDSTANDH